MSQSNGRPDPMDDFGGNGAQHAAPNPIVLVHRRLRGRYPLAVGLGAALGLIGCIVGYFVTNPQFASVGIVEVKASTPKIMYETEQNDLMPMFETFVQTQSEWLQSDRIIRKAAANPALLQAGWPAGDEGIKEMSENLAVYSARRSSTISVRVTHENRQLAQAGVNAVLDAYHEVFGDQLGMNNDQIQRTLAERQTRLQRELDGLRESVFRQAEEYGADTLDMRLNSALIDEERYNQVVTQLEIALLNYPEDDASATNDGDEVIAEALPIAELTRHDATLAAMVDELDALEIREVSMRAQYGPNHRLMKNLQREIAILKEQIDKRAKQVQFELDQTAAEGGTVAGTASKTELERRLSQAEQLRARASQDVKELSQKRRTIASLREQADGVKELLGETSKRLEELRVEAEASGNRVLIAQRGDLPIMPSKDKRLQLAAAGVIAGGGAGVGFVFLMGLIRPTYRFIDEVDHAHQAAPLLGTLPDFSGGDSEERDMAALAVHHLRNALRVEPRPGVGVILTITSAASGDGKTSLAMALGTSFAAAGHKTIVVDADLIGRGLTREMGLEQAKGFSEAVEGPKDSAAKVRPLLSDSGVANLRILSAGVRDVIDAKQLSSGNVVPVVNALRELGDVVLVDTGPLLGSLEANILAPLSDSVIVTVSRGQQAKLVRATVERLSRMGARCAGLVFNRAASVDFRSSVSHASIRSTSRTSIIDPPTPEERERGGRAALMHAVAGHYEEGDEPEPQT